MQSQSQFESFAVVNGKDEQLHAAFSKKELHESKLLHRGVHVFIEVFGGRFVLQRKANKPGIENAGTWSSAVSGHVRFNESYESAAIRESMEELHLLLNPSDMRKILKDFPTEENGFEFVTLFSYLLDPKEEFPRISEEVEEIVVVPLDLLIKDITNNRKKYSPVFVSLFNKFLVLEKGLED
jgi:isopentenyldiphosphate isomerase